MGTRAFRAPGLKLELEETAEETTVHCSGRITAESAENKMKGLFGGK